MTLFRFSSISILVIVLQLGCALETKSIEKSSITAEKNKTTACIVSKDFQSKLTNQGIVVEIKNDLLTITNTLSTPKNIRINRGFGAYEINSKSSETIYNILNEKNCIEVEIQK